MNKAIKILLGILCIPLIILGIKCMLAPDSMTVKLGIELQGVNGLSTMRSMIAGILLSSGLMIAAGLKTKNTTWLLAAGLAMAVVLVGRFLGIAMDGYDPHVLPPIIIELVIVGLAVAAHKRFPSKS
ncbi:MAG: uncharacterized membrane protein (UPF0136 family) [Candidatus Marinamargulisbacteria bacterium]|jgi:uncharacterized membrane protein (UPF0136 family)